ncbi:MAG: hypothetical protein ACOC10_06665 [Bacteroidota bacterium]
MEHVSSNKSFETGRFWFTLDNAAKIYPAVITKNFTAVFRITAVLEQPVQIKLLQKSVLLAEQRYPYLKVKLKEGFFWYYLEQHFRHFPVEVDDKPYCRKFEKNDLLIRIRAKNNRISAEFSHILTDGSAGLEFLKTILILYSRECGASIPEEFYRNLENQIDEEEYEDAYKRYFKAEIPPMVRKSKAFHLPYPLASTPRLSLLNVIIPIEQLQKVAGQKKVSITVYLVSVYLFVLQEISESLDGPGKFTKSKRLRVQVPVNLRQIFPSKTMRNFSLFVMPEIDLRLGHYTFDEIIKSVFHQSKLETDEKLINKNISRNVGSEKKLYIRSIPLFLKSFILRLKYYSLGTSQYSGVITNLGKIELPPEAEKMIDYFIMTPPPPNKMLKVSCGVAGFGGKLVLSFGNVTQSKAFEEKFIQFISSQNITIKLESNKENV